MIIDYPIKAKSFSGNVDYSSLSNRYSLPCGFRFRKADNFVQFMKMKRLCLKWIFHFVIAMLAAFSGVQILLSLSDLFSDAGSNLVQLTFVEPDNNLEFQKHPYYTVCPILEKSANLSDPTSTLLNVIDKNGLFYPPSLFIEILNGPSLKVTRFSTWVKMKTASKDQSDALVHCTTYSIPNNITLGSNEAKVLRNIPTLSFILDGMLPDKPDSLWR